MVTVGGCYRFGRAYRVADRERRHRPRRRMCCALDPCALNLRVLTAGARNATRSDRSAPFARPSDPRAPAGEGAAHVQPPGGPPGWSSHVTMQRAKSQGREAARRGARTLDFLTAAWYPVGGGRLCACRPRGALARALCAHLRRKPRSAMSDSAAPFAARERRHRPSDKGALCPCGSGPNAR